MVEHEMAKAPSLVIGRPVDEDTTQVQSVVFDKSDWDLDEARDWIVDHDFVDQGVDETGDSYRFRQRDPDSFTEDSFRTIKPGENESSTDNAFWDEKKRHQDHRLRDEDEEADRMRSVVNRAELDLQFRTTFKAELAPQSSPVQKAYPKARTLRLKGDFIDTSMNDNRWGVPASELASISQQLASRTVQVRLDHADQVRSVVGCYTTGEVRDADDNPIPVDASPDELERGAKVRFGAEITTEDSSVMVPILTGYVDSVSPNVTAEHIECGVCGKEILEQGMVPTCDHFDSPNSPGWYLLRGVTVVEGSIVATPAYKSTQFLPVGFAAGLDKKTTEMRHNMSQKKEGPDGGGAGHAAGVDNPLLEKLLEAKDERISELKASLDRLERRFEAQKSPDPETDPENKFAEVTEEEYESMTEEEKAEYDRQKAMYYEKKAKKLEEELKAYDPEDEKTKVAQEEKKRREAQRKAARQGAPVEPARGKDDGGGNEPGGMRRPWGAMAGSLHSDAHAQFDSAAVGEIKEALAGKRPLGRFGGPVDGMLEAGGDA